jgi:hypothetical protein
MASFRSSLILMGGLLLTALPASSGGCSSSAGCVDFTLTSADTACNVDHDCTFIDALRVCPGDPECGGEVPVNLAAEARYASATQGVPRTSVLCGAPSPVACVQHVCTEVSPTFDAGTDASGSDGG